MCCNKRQYDRVAALIYTCNCPYNRCDRNPDVVYAILPSPIACSNHFTNEGLKFPCAYNRIVTGICGDRQASLDASNAGSNGNGVYVDIGTTLALARSVPMNNGQYGLKTFAGTVNS
jgi:hypothetical protein